MRTFFRAAVVSWAVSVAAVAAPPVYTPPSLGPWPAATVDPLIAAVDRAELRRWHDLLGSEPHVAGTPGDLRQADRIAEAFAKMGLEVERHEIHVYLARPVAAVLELIEPGADGTPGKRSRLVTKEEILADDADSANPDLSWGWNAYSGSGDVVAPVVYANQGTRADFAKLKDMGVDLRGKVVLCRYGGNFRGYKAKFAQAAGAAAVVIFTDPGVAEANTAPRPGTAQDTCIERGSVNTLDYSGDPLTPFVEAKKDAQRLDPASVPLPTILVQPVGFGAGRAILAAMAQHEQEGESAGPALPEGWQGGLRIPYTVVGPDSVRVRVKVEQVREVCKTFNIVGTLAGAARPGQWVLVGSHHDAWGFGACDPLAGTICTMEAARVFSEAAKCGWLPQRTLKFCAWGAEEFSIIGSTEWVESRREELARKAVAYINLDMAAMGPDFGSAAAPELKTVIAAVAAHVPACGGGTVLESWLARKDGADAALPGAPKFGDLGGGSDHVAFWCHAGVPSCSMSSGGAAGGRSAYHSVYDTLAWYRKNIGEDYAPAEMVTKMVVGTLARLADDDREPTDPARTLWDIAARLEALAPTADEMGPEAAASVRGLIPRMRTAAGNLRGLPGVGGLRKRLMSEDGLPGRAWYRNEVASPDADSGYAAWVLPRLTMALDRRDKAAALEALDRLGKLAIWAESGAGPGK